MRYKNLNLFFHSLLLSFVVITGYKAKRQHLFFFQSCLKCEEILYRFEIFESFAKKLFAFLIRANIVELDILIINLFGLSAIFFKNVCEKYF